MGHPPAARRRWTRPTAPSAPRGSCSAEASAASEPPASCKKSDVDVTVVDKHDYHTFQPLLYQVATDLLEPSAVGHPLRDLFHEQPNVTVHEAEVTGIDLAGREVQFADMAPLPTTTSSSPSAPGSSSSASTGAAEHAFPMYTLADAVRLKDHVLETVGGGRQGPGAGGRRGAQRRHRRRRAHRHRERRRPGRAVPQQLRPGLPGASRRTRRGSSWSRPAPPSCRCSRRTSAPTRSEALEKRGVEVLLGEVVASVEPTRVTLKSGTVLDAHTLVWGAGLQASPLVDSLGLELQHGHRLPAEPDLSVAGHPEVFAVGDIAWITDTKTNDGPPPARLGRPPGRRARRREHRSPGRRKGHRAVRLPRQGHDGDDRSGRRGDPDPRRAARSRARRRRWRGAPSTSRCCPPARTGPRRSSTGRGRDSPTSAPGRITVRTDQD